LGVVLAPSPYNNLNMLWKRQQQTNLLQLPQTHPQDPLARNH